MIESQLINRLLNCLKEERDRHEKLLLGGQHIDDYEKYRHMVGIITGLLVAEKVVNQVLKEEAEHGF